MNTLSTREQKIIKNFLKNGYIIFNIENKKLLKNIKTDVILESSKILKIKNSKLNNSNFLNYTHQFIGKDKLNSFRLKIYNKLNNNKKFILNYYLLGREYIDLICGNELAVQKKINLSIQLPHDPFSTLPIHSDVWSGNSPFEVVLWIPLVSVKKTKSMFILPPNQNNYYYKNLNKFKSSESIFLHGKKKLKWLSLKYGQGLIFSQNLLHGNITNKEKTSRWSFNCRFKSLFSPYDKKKIGEYFLPLNLRAATKLGMDYEDPKI